MDRFKYMQGWLIDWDTACAYIPREDQPTDIATVYVRYNRTTGQRDEVFYHDLPEELRKWMSTNH